jgi:putative transposase
MADEKRASKPSKITLTQMNQMVAIACEKPEGHGIPISKWSYEVLAQVIVEKNIVESISPSYVWKILQKKLQPHKVKNWMFPKIEDLE